MKLFNKKKQFGQGMTEYIIIVALIAIAGIAAFSFFGATARAQIGNMAQGLSGAAGTQDAATPGAAANTGGAGLSNFASGAAQQGATAEEPVTP